MTILEERIRNHLLEFKDKKGLSQMGMALHIRLGYRTYQDIEKTGKIIKFEDFLKIVEKTGFVFTQELANKENRSEDHPEYNIDDLINLLKQQQQTIASLLEARFKKDVK